ncbi:LLM class flavin-dependent oxidoreductase [Yinghuangia aomiensis]
MADTNSTKAEWDEVSREIVRMWEQYDCTFQGEHLTVPTPHNILPKPYGHAHPPIWMACGNPRSFAKAGSLGVGAIAFNFEPDLQPEGPHRGLQGGRGEPRSRSSATSRTTT